jgi:hypothetical protein
MKARQLSDEQIVAVLQAVLRAVLQQAARGEKVEREAPRYYQELNANSASRESSAL